MTRLSAPIAFTLAGALVLTACAQPGSFDPNDPNKRTREGAIAGAVVGGVGGLIDGDGDLNNIIVGAAGGAAVGGIIGNILDKQAAELERDLGRDVDVTNTGEELIVTMPQDILFAFDSDRLRPDLQRDLTTVAESVNRYRDSNVVVVGHTDNVGSASYNYDLSTRRANSVVNVLASRGVSPSRLRAVGRGEDQPVASNLSDRGRALNRRVEIVIQPYRR